MSSCLDSKAIDKNIIFQDHIKNSITLNTLNLILIKQSDRLSDCNLVLLVNREIYLYIDNYALFNLKLEVRGLFSNKEFQTTDLIKINLRLKSDLINDLTKHGNNEEEIVNYLLILCQENPCHPLLYTENWLALSVTQQLDSGEIGYNTLWNYINPSALAAGEIDSEEVGTAVAKFFANWTESHLAANLQKSTSEILDGITNFFQEFVDESLNTMPKQNQRKSARIQNIDEPESSLTEPILLEKDAASDRVSIPPLVDDEVDEISSDRIIQALIDFFEKDEWSFSINETEAILQITFQGDNSGWSCYARARETQQQAVFYSIFPVNAPEHKRNAIAEFITRANYGTVIGNFELDFDDGEIRYKTSIDVEDDRLSFALIENLVYANVSTMDKYLPGMMSIIYADVEPKQAIDLIE